MNQIQEEIAKALEQLAGKTLLTEAAVAKKIRENLKLEGKNKAGLSFHDIEEAVFYLEENKSLHYTVHLNSANDILIKPGEAAAGLESDAREDRAVPCLPSDNFRLNRLKERKSVELRHGACRKRGQQSAQLLKSGLYLIFQMPADRFQLDAHDLLIMIWQRRS